MPQNELALALLDVRGGARGAMGCGGSKEEADAPTGVDAAAKSEGKKLAVVSGGVRRDSGHGREIKHKLLCSIYRSILNSQ